MSFLKADGAHDIHAQLDLSGEPLIPDLAAAFRLKPPMGLLEYQDFTLQGLEYEIQYSDYWNATAEEDGKGLYLDLEIKSVKVVYRPDC